MTQTDRDFELEARDTERRRSASTRAKAVLGWTGASAVLVAGTALATVTFTGDDTTTVETPTGRSDTRAPACTWSSEVDGPVFPEHNVGAAPTPESVLVFETCSGEWTGDLAWLNPGEGQGTTNSGDDGLPNPWEAGNRAVERLDE
jgi:hypothetical protein